MVFGKSAVDVEKWSKGTVKAFGLSEGTALDMASGFGDLGTSMGLTDEQASKMAMSLTGLSGDLASFKNVKKEVAETALKSIFTGETESLKAMGVVMTQANLETFAMATGHKKAYKAMSEAEKIQIRYAYVMKATANAQGDYARTADGTANVTRTFSETLKQLGTDFGQYLLPVITPVIQKMSEMLVAFGAMSSEMKKIILVVGAVGIVLFPLIAGLGMVATAISKMIVVGKLVFTFFAGFGSAFQTLQIMALYAGEAFVALAGIVGVSVGALIAIIVGIGVAVFLVIKYWDEIKAFTITAWTAIVDFLSACLTGFVGFFTGIFSTISGFITSTVIPIFNAIGSAFSYVFNDIISPILQYFISFFIAVGALVAWVVGQVIGGAIKGLGAVFTWLYNVAVKPVMNGIKLAFTALGTALLPVFNAIKSAFTSFVTGIKSACTAVGVPVINGIKTVVSSLGTAWGKTWDTAKSKFSDFVGGIKKLWAGIKDSFKLPHISISGKFNFVPPNLSVPKMSVAWNAKGGIFNKPTVLGGGQGVGEAGSEAIIPLSNSNAVKPFAKAVASQFNSMTDSAKSSGAGNSIVLNIVNNVKDNETAQELSKRIADDVSKEINRLQERNRRGTGVFA